MPVAEDLADARFKNNMKRIRGIIQLILNCREGPLERSFVKRSGVGADILRSCIVFLRATFESMLRTYVRAVS